MKHSSKPTKAIWSHQFHTPQFTQEAGRLNTLIYAEVTEKVKRNVFLSFPP